MSFYSDKKKEHEALAETALKNKNYATAFYHVTEAARYTFSLAEQCSGELRDAYVSNANDLMDIAEELKGKMAKSGKQPKNKVEEAVDKSSSGSDDDNGGNDNGEDSAMRLAIPRERLTDVSGMEDAKAFVLNKVITPLRDPDRAKKYALTKGGGLLLYGLPGTGKTFFAKAVAGELGVPFYVLDTSKIMNKYVGESQKAIKELFDTARKNPMSVIFIDETNEILPSRNDPGVHQTTVQVENIILQEADGIDSDTKNPFLLIGATNYPGNLDDAALSRFPHRVEVALPDAKTRRFILERELKCMQIHVADDALAFLEEKTDGFSCRDIVQYAEELRGLASQHELNELTRDFCVKNFIDKHVTSTVVADSIREFKKRIGASGEDEKKK